MSSSNTAGIGVIGTGWWATQFHIPAILASANGHLAGIADRDADRLRAAVGAFQPTFSTTDHHELLSNPDVQGVLIATPHSSHFALAKDALLAGKHVLVEKPLALTGRDARELRELAHAQKRALIVGHTYQHTRHAKKAHEIVRSGAIGDVTFVSALFASMVTAYYQGNPDEYRAVFNFPVNGPGADTYSNPALSGGGQAWTQMTHLMDMVFWVTGLRGKKVFARMENLDLGVDVIDAMSFSFDNGAIGTAGSTGQLKPGQSQQQELRYYGTEGYVLQELIQGTLTIVYNDGRVEEVPDAGADELYPAGAPVQALIDICSGGDVPLDSADSSVATVEFLEAAYRSVASGHDETIGPKNA
ncbi:MAG: Gfo/Idh/MocA family oxidoreductase [Microbacteriaceae bacterium]|nr:Gfo/Idh/MocA family oxidoreductase [Microbacteriaceae bacterium]